MKGWGVICLVLLAGLASAGEDEARAKFEEHCRRGFEIVRANDGVLSVADIRRAADEFGRAGLAAADGGLHSDAAKMHLNRISLLKKIFDYAELLVASQDLLRVQEKMGSAAEEAGCLTRMDIGQLHHCTGNPGLALRALTDACSWYTRNGHGFLAACARLRIADARRDCGEYAAALRDAEAAFPVIEAADDLEEYLGALNVLGRLHRELGNTERAEKLYREGLSLTRKGNAVYRAGFHLAMAEILAARGDRKGAEGRLHAAYGLFMKKADYAGGARALLHLGLLKAQAGEQALTIAYCSLARRLGGMDPYVRCSADLLAGEAHLARKRTAQARRALEDARVLSTALGNPALVGWVESDLAEVCLREERVPEAIEHTRLGLAALGKAGRELSVVTAHRVRPEMRQLVDRAVRAAFAAEDPAVTFDLLERSRACALVCALGGRERFWSPHADPSASTELSSARADILTARRQIDMATNRNSRKDATRHTKALRQAQEQFRLASERLGHASPSPLGPAPEQFVKLADTRKSLAADEALVLYGFGGGRLYALVVRKSGVSRHDLGAEASVRDGIAELRRSFDEASATPPLDRLREQLLDPLKLGSDVARVLISPVGPLATTPFAALLPDLEVAFVPSATSRALLLAQKPERGERGKRGLAVGDPVYSGERQAAFRNLHRGSGELYQLKNALREIEVATVETDRRLVGEKATEAGFRDVLKTERRWRVIHFACHGVVDRREPAWSALAITPQGADDGYLAVAEILTMRIPADLAVLSACSTGVGKSYRGEGLLALPGAFLHAGTPRVIASLWKVDDKATRAMMTEFYRYWRPKDGGEGLPAAKALKKAQQVLREGEFKDPRHWAAWVLWGLPD